jgi:hypothetical protein
LQVGGLFALCTTSRRSPARPLARSPHPPRPAPTGPPDTRAADSSTSFFATTVSKALQPATLAVLVCLWWGSPLVTFHPGRLWPLGHAFAFPGYASGAVGVFSWHFICQRTFKRAAGMLGYA